jgi:hypothetical protein
MISRVPLTCLSCSAAITARIQIGHEERQRISTVCPSCFAPITLTLDLSNPPSVTAPLLDGCRIEDEQDEAGVVLNLGTGYVISRSRLHDDKYFPSFDLPKPTAAELAEFGDARVIDIIDVLGGIPDVQGKWRLLRNAYRHQQIGRLDLAQRALHELYPHDNIANIKIEGAVSTFLVRVLKPLGEPRLSALLESVKDVRQQFPEEFERMREVFRARREDRMNDYMEVFQHFFRAFDEFNQTLIYVRRGVGLPDDPYAPSTDFDNTKMYYGEAFESLGSGLDFLVSLNNIINDRSFDQLQHVSLERYRESDKGRRGEAVRTSDAFGFIVEEYDNQLRNASHHRWLKLSSDRSIISYQVGGRGAVQSLSYAEYLLRCNRITMNLMLLASLELIVLR